MPRMQVGDDEEELYEKDDTGGDDNDKWVS